MSCRPCAVCFRSSLLTNAASNYYRAAQALSGLVEALAGKYTGISIVDSTPLCVCDNLRISRHRVFQGMAHRGKSSTGWFFGFKLHVVINHRGELRAVQITPGNVDDRQPVPGLMEGGLGLLFSDKGHLSKKLTAKLEDRGIKLVTKVRKNMKPINHQRLRRLY